MKLIIPDLHISATWNSGGLDRSDDIFKNLEQIKQDNKQNQITHCVFLGDIFDSPNPSHTYISRFIKYLDSWGPLTTHIIIRGNHDGYEGSKKGSPLEEVEASAVAKIIWKPQIFQNMAFIPYTSQKEVDEFIKSLDVTAKDMICFSHTDIESAIPGVEKDLVRGTGCLLKTEDTDRFRTVFSGHIHKAQDLGNVHIVGSILKATITEQDDQKIYVRLHPNGDIEKVKIDCRPLLNFDIDLSEPQTILNDLLVKPESFFSKDSIVSVRISCPIEKQQEVDLNLLNDTLKQHCFHVRVVLDVVKHKAFRMVEMNDATTDYEKAKKWVESQAHLTNKEKVLECVKGVLDEE